MAVASGELELTACPRSDYIVSVSICFPFSITDAIVSALPLFAPSFVKAPQLTAAVNVATDYERSADNPAFHPP